MKIGMSWRCLWLASLALSCYPGDPLCYEVAFTADCFFEEPYPGDPFGGDPFGGGSGGGCELGGFDGVCVTGECPVGTIRVNGVCQYVEDAFPPGPGEGPGGPIGEGGGGTVEQPVDFNVCPQAQSNCFNQLRELYPNCGACSTEGLRYVTACMQLEGCPDLASGGPVACPMPAPSCTTPPPAPTPRQRQRDPRLGGRR